MLRLAFGIQNTKPYHSNFVLLGPDEFRGSVVKYDNSSHVTIILVTVAL